MYWDMWWPSNVFARGDDMCWLLMVYLGCMRSGIFRNEIFQLSFVHFMQYYTEPIILQNILSLSKSAWNNFNKIWYFHSNIYHIIWIAKLLLKRWSQEHQTISIYSIPLICLNIVITSWRIHCYLLFVYASEIGV